MAKLKTVASFIFNFPYGENLILVYLIMTNIKIILILQTQQEGRRKVNFFFFLKKKEKRKEKYIKGRWIRVDNLVKSVEEEETEKMRCKTWLKIMRTRRPHVYQIQGTYKCVWRG